MANDCRLYCCSLSPLHFQLVVQRRSSTAETTANDTDVFISDKPDPEAGSVPPFVLPDLEDVDEEENISAAELSQTRDFSLLDNPTPYQVGPDQRTLQEYRFEQLESIERNESTSLWFPDSERSNGTLVTDAHVTILGTEEGTQTRLELDAGDQYGNESELLLVPRDGTVLTHLDYSTRIPEGPAPRPMRPGPASTSHSSIKKLIGHSRLGPNPGWRSRDAPPARLRGRGRERGDNAGGRSDNHLEACSPRDHLRP